MEKLFKLFSFEDEILKLIYSQELYTTSDLQGVVAVIVDKIYNYGKQEGEANGKRPV